MTVKELHSRELKTQNPHLLDLLKISYLALDKLFVISTKWLSTAFLVQLYRGKAESPLQVQNCFRIQPLLYTEQILHLLLTLLLI